MLPFGSFIFYFSNLCVSGEANRISGGKDSENATYRPRVVGELGKYQLKGVGVKRTFILQIYINYAPFLSLQNRLLHYFYTEHTYTISMRLLKFLIGL